MSEYTKNSPKYDPKMTESTLKWFDMPRPLPHNLRMPDRAVHFAFGAGLSVILIEGAPL
jgi:hypothetical protein